MPAIRLDAHCAWPRGVWGNGGHAGLPRARTLDGLEGIVGAKEAAEDAVAALGREVIHLVRVCAAAGLAAAAMLEKILASEVIHAFPLGCVRERAPL